MPTSKPTSVEVFRRLAAGQRSTPPQPEPPFPPIPDEIKNKFSDLKPYWEAYEKAIAAWLVKKQTP